MEISEYKNIFVNENSHFYYVANHNLIISLVKDYVTKPACAGREKLKILDAGCGTGLLAKKLEIYGDVQGIDISPDALFFSKKRKVKAKLASINKIPFKKNSFDLVVCLDVLYHQWIENDKKALKEIYRVLKPNATLILRVPATPWLNLTHDKFVFTRERYDKRQLQNKLQQSGFRVEKISYIDSILFVPAMLLHFWEKVLKPKNGSSIRKLPFFLNIILSKILFLESRILLQINLPFGLGLLAICKKPN